MRPLAFAATRQPIPSSPPLSAPLSQALHCSAPGAVASASPRARTPARRPSRRGPDPRSGTTLAVGSLALQLRLAPYRAAEANLLKALVDGQIFLTFLISFVLCAAAPSPPSSAAA